MKWLYVNDYTQIQADYNQVFDLEKCPFKLMSMLKKQTISSEEFAS